MASLAIYKDDKICYSKQLRFSEVANQTIANKELSIELSSYLPPLDARLPLGVPVLVHQTHTVPYPIVSKKAKNASERDTNP